MENAKCEMRNAKCKMQNGKCKMWNAICTVAHWGHSRNCKIRKIKLQNQQDAHAHHFASVSEVTWRTCSCLAQSPLLGPRYALVRVLGLYWPMYGFSLSVCDDDVLPIARTEPRTASTAWPDTTVTQTPSGQNKHSNWPKTSIRKYPRH